MSKVHTGSTVYAKTNHGSFRKLVLGEMVGDGGAVGNVYRVEGSPRECVKVFHSSTDATTVAVRIPKVKSLIDKYEQGEIGGFATLPTAIVYGEQTSDSPIGYAMDYFEGILLSELAFADVDDTFSLEERARAAYQLADCVAHAHGIASDPMTRRIVIGDLSLANAIYQPQTGKVRIVDPDSFQLAGRTGNKMVAYPVTEMRSSTYETVNATAPLGKFLLTSRSDNVLLAECVFKLLMRCDPLDDITLVDVDLEEARDEAIAARRYPYLEVPCPPEELPEAIVGEELAHLFVRSFTGPFENVPFATEYRDAIGRLIGMAAKRDVGPKKPTKAPSAPVAVGKGGTVYRPVANRAMGVKASPAMTIGAAPSPTRAYCGEPMKKARIVAGTLCDLLSFLARTLPWAVFAVTALYHVTTALPLGPLALLRSVASDHTSLVAILVSLGIMLWSRHDTDALDSPGAALAVIGTLLIVSSLCPATVKGVVILQDDIIALLIRLGII